ncbi:MAG: hypothetical protein ABS949_07470 [Solibacillus sp.]
MKEKQFTVAGTDIDEVKLLNEAFGLSYNDAIAMLVHAAEVDTVDDIPPEPLKEKAEVDSDLDDLNQIPGSIRVGRNAPRS